LDISDFRERKAFSSHFLLEEMFNEGISFIGILLAGPALASEYPSLILSAV